MIDCSYYESIFNLSRIGGNVDLSRTRLEQHTQQTATTRMPKRIREYNNMNTTTNFNDLDDDTTASMILALAENGSRKSNVYYGEYNDEIGEYSPPLKKPRVSDFDTGCICHYCSLKKELGNPDDFVADLPLDTIQFDCDTTVKTFALTKQGDVYAKKCISCHELLFGNNTMNAASCHWERITGISDKVKQISCGLLHVLFLTEKGHVYSCGCNRYGQLVCITPIIISGYW